jgi:hypothetical protein
MNPLKVDDLDCKRLVWFRHDGTGERYTLDVRHRVFPPSPLVYAIPDPILPLRAPQLKSQFATASPQREYIGQKEVKMDQATVERIEHVESGSKEEMDYGSHFAIVENEQSRPSIKKDLPGKRI